MEKKKKLGIPRYQQIALDIASSIVEKQYDIGDVISDRSTIASEYSVSPDTIRKAISILTDYEIVEIKIGKGIIVKSYENALKFVQNYNDLQKVTDLKKELMEGIERQKKEIDHLCQIMMRIIDETERISSFNPFIPYEIKITRNSAYINESLSDLKFWQNTQATIIAIKRNKKLIKSPGPHAILLENDIIYFIGNEGCYERVKNFIYPKKNND